MDSSSTRIDGANSARQLSNRWSETPIVTGSPALIALATAANASWAGPAWSLQKSPRSGQAIQQPACARNSAGIRKPSAAGVLATVTLIPACIPERPGSSDSAPRTPATIGQTSAFRPLIAYSGRDCPKRTATTKPGVTRQGTR